MDIQALSKKFGINAEYRTGGTFPVFAERMKGRRVLLVADETTQRFFPLIEPVVRGAAAACATFVLPEREPVADEQTVAKVAAAGEGYDYLLAVGAGTLNDLCKYAGFLTHRESGVFATAPRRRRPTCSSIPPCCAPRPAS